MAELPQLAIQDSPPLPIETFQPAEGLGFNGHYIALPVDRSNRQDRVAAGHVERKNDIVPVHIGRETVMNGFNWMRAEEELNTDIAQKHILQLDQNHIFSYSWNRLVETNYSSIQAPVEYNPRINETG